MTTIKQEPNAGASSNKSSSGPGSNEPPVIIKQEKMDTTPAGPGVGSGISNSSSVPNIASQQGPNMKPPPEKRPRL